MPPVLWERVLSDYYAAGIADYLSEQSHTLHTLNALQHHTGELEESASASAMAVFSGATHSGTLRIWSQLLPYIRSEFARRLYV